MNRLVVSPGLRQAFNPRSAIVPLKTLHQHRRYAHQSYGGGEGDPKGEKPQDQGSNPSADKEHPGPPPPTEGQGSGGGPTKANESGHNTNDNASSQGGGSQGGGSKGAASSSGAQPKILNASVPAEPSDEVKQHNKEMANRHDRAGIQVGNQGDEKVGKGYWSGMLPLILHST